MPVDSSPMVGDAAAEAESARQRLWAALRRIAEGPEEGGDEPPLLSAPGGSPEADAAARRFRPLATRVFVAAVWLVLAAGYLPVLPAILGTAARGDPTALAALLLLSPGTAASAWCSLDAYQARAARPPGGRRRRQLHCAPWPHAPLALPP